MDDSGAHRPGLITVGCCGCFDYELHEGHKEFLDFASKQGDRLVVFVVSDCTLERLKNRRPFYSQQTRIRKLEALACIYHAVPITEDDDLANQDYILNAGLDVYVFGPDQNSSWNITLAERLDRQGVKVVRSPFKKRFSTTRILLESNGPSCDGS